MAAKAPATDDAPAPDRARTHNKDNGHAHRHHPITREGTHPGAGPEEKAALIKGASQLLLDVPKKPLEATFVVIDEVDTDNCGWGGLPVQEYRKKRARDRMASAR